MTDLARSTLTGHQRAVADRALAVESARRKHLVVSLSGAHAYGFPSPDSDLDLKAVHVDPPAMLLGFPRTATSAERLEVIDGVEIDYSSNELGSVLLGVLKGNGNYLERLLSGFEMVAAPELESLRPLVVASLSRRVHRHYLGFATQQRLEWEKTERRSAKKLLYVLRTTLTGAHLLRTGQVQTDVTQLLEEYGFPEARQLVDEKRRGERSELPQELSREWERRLPEAFERLEKALEGSVLPAEPTEPAASALEQWLIRCRLDAL